MSSKISLRKQTRFNTFKERLTFLMGNERPYAWCRKVGIEKGLFQYYWQKEKIPKYENLRKIQDYTGCSLDWLLADKGDPFPDRIDDIGASIDLLLEQVDKQIAKLESQATRLNTIRSSLLKRRP